jgi:hypothetical protein
MIPAETIARIATLALTPEQAASVASMLREVEDATKAEGNVVLDARRKRDRERKRFHGIPRTSEEIHGTPRNSTESAETVSLETKVPTPLKTQTLSKENPPKGGQKKGTEAFDRFKTAYPKRAGNNPWEPARQKFAAAVADGVDPECIVGGAANYAAAEALLNHVGTEFVMQAKTWLNQKCWQDYGDAVDGDGRMIAKSDMRWQFLVARYEREKGKKFPHRAERWPFPEAWLHDANNATPEAPRWLLREPALWTA